MRERFYFAWVDEDETEFNGSHLRNDEEIFTFSIDQNEGECATLTIEMRNPRVGLLAPGRKLWAWFSMYDHESASESEESESESESEGELSAAGFIPLFHGRLNGVPEDIEGEVITLSFTAQPADMQEQKAAVADGLKVAPYWDPVWFSPDTVDDPDNVLESRPELWDVDRVTNVVTTSNIIDGEDGTILFDEGIAFYDSIRISYGEAPATVVNMNAGVSWNQQAAGSVDISSMLAHGDYFGVVTYTGDQLLDKWPKAGASIGGGWEVAGSSIQRVDGVGQAIWDYAAINYVFGHSQVSHDLIVPEWATDYTFSIGGNIQHYPAHVFRMPKQRFVVSMSIGYSTSRSKSETLAFSLTADVQSTVTDPAGSNVIELTMNSSEVVSPIDPGGAMPIGDLSARTYFSTKRGTQSVEYLLMVARAQLLARARCVHVEFEVPFMYGVRERISTRKNGVLYDHRLPGGVAAGKITSYTLSGNGDSGVFACDVTIECTAGHSGVVSAEPGTPSYADDGYVADDYQFRTDQFTMPLVGEIAYSSIEGLPPNDDGLDFNRMSPYRVVRSIAKSNFPADQEAAMGTSAHEPNDVFERLNDVPATWTLNLVPVTGGPFQTDFAINTTVLKVPKTIDLEASSL